MNSSVFWDITMCSPGNVTGLAEHYILEDRTHHIQNVWKFAPTNSTILHEHTKMPFDKISTKAKLN
jgi:hypothetical protein